MDYMSEVERGGEVRVSRFYRCPVWVLGFSMKGLLLGDLRMAWYSSLANLLIGSSLL